VSNDGWFGGSLAPDQHLQIARMRALEAARPVLRATNTGVTAVIGADGVIQQQLPRSEYAVLEVVVQPVRGVTPYLYWSSMAFL
jgi:apolipoprotein N-acyltransferase